jgi:hypothetical protein
VNKLLTPQILLVSVLAGWLNREQQKILEYLRQVARDLAAFDDSFLNPCVVSPFRGQSF